MSNLQNLWIITPDEKSKLERQFFDLKPSNGFITGVQAKSLFMKSELSKEILGKIWSLSDYDNDGQMTLTEFCIAMHLIKRKLEGCEVPDTLPTQLATLSYNSTCNYMPYMPPANPYITIPAMQSSTMQRSLNNMRPMSSPNVYSTYNMMASSVPVIYTPCQELVGITSIKSVTSDEEWSMNQAIKPRYRLQFNQQDHNKRGFLTSVEAKAILVQSGLPQNSLAQIWSLADNDKDGRLTCEEFCVAMHLVEGALSGKILPNQLPTSFFSQSFQRQGFHTSSMSAIGGISYSSTTNGLQTKQNSNEKENKSVINVEDERRANYLKGQAELEKRRLILEEQRQMEEENRRAKERAEFEKLEKIRIEKEQARNAEIQRQMELRRQQELEWEDQMKRVAEEREKNRLDSEKRRLLELEMKRLEVAMNEKKQEQELLSEINRKRVHFLEALAKEKEKKQHLQSRIDVTKISSDSYKVGLDSIMENRNNVQATTEFLKKDIEKAKYELNRYEVEKHTLEVQLKSFLQSDPVSDEIKTVQAMKINQKEKNYHLNKEILYLEQRLTKSGQKLVSNRNKVKDLDRKVTAKLISEIIKLQTSVCEKKSAALNVIKKQKARSSVDNSLTNDLSPKYSTSRKSFSNASKTLRLKVNENLVYYTALYPFEGKNIDELNFKEGDTIVVDKNDQSASSSGWLYGYVFGTDKSGIFPETFVNIVNDESSPKSLKSLESVNINTQCNVDSPKNDVLGCNNTNTITTPINSILNLSKKVDQIVDINTSKVFVVALFPYQSSIFGDLNIQPGDIIETIEQKQDWWKGYNRSTKQRGLFPSNYVRLLAEEEISRVDEPHFCPVLTNQPLDFFNANTDSTINVINSNTYNSLPDIDSATLDLMSSILSAPNGVAVMHEMVEVMIEFVASGVEQLSLQVGQILEVCEKSQSGWWKGEIQQQSQERRIGWFPGHYVKSINTLQGKDILKYSNSCITPNNNTSTHMNSCSPNKDQSRDVVLNLNDSVPGDQIITMYNYTAQNVDELSFEKNVILKLIAKNEAEWWMGCNLLTKQEGLFPVNYVRRLDLENVVDQESVAAVKKIETRRNSIVTGRPMSCSKRRSSSVRLSKGYIDGIPTFNVLMTESEKKRQFYIQELIETEKSYYEDLKEVLEIFFEPIKQSNLLNEDDMKEIFLNWSDLIPSSYNFYMALKIRKDRAGKQQPIQSIGDILLSNFPNFIVYVRFCSMQNQAIAKLQKWQQQNAQFKELCEKCEANLRCQKMPMTSYFLKPMQRITKYKLIVENILNNTEDNHPDRSDIEEAVAAARNLCESVNEGVRERENSERLEWLQEHLQCDTLSEKLYFNSDTNCLGHRKILYSGTLYKAKYTKKELVGFLFNDFFLLAIPCYNTGGTPFVFPLETSSKSKMQFKMYKKPIILNQVLISAGAPTVNSNSGNVQPTNNDIFTVKENNSQHVLRALSINDRDKWVERIMDASLFYINTENSKKERSMSMRRTAGVGRLVLTVIEGINLHRTRKEGKCDPFCEASIGSQLHRTKVISSTVNPKWSTQMQFLVKNIDQDVLCLTVYNKDYFAPNEFLGRIEVSVSSVMQGKKRCRDAAEKKLKLMEIDSGELVVKMDMALFKKN